MSSVLHTTRCHSHREAPAIAAIMVAVASPEAAGCYHCCWQQQPRTISTALPRVFASLHTGAAQLVTGDQSIYHCELTALQGLLLHGKLTYVLGVLLYGTSDQFKHAWSIYIHCVCHNKQQATSTCAVRGFSAGSQLQVTLMFVDSAMHYQQKRNLCDDPACYRSCIE